MNFGVYCKLLLQDQSHHSSSELMAVEDFITLTRIYIRDKSTTLTEILMTASVSTLDVISNIGGTFGLFTGFSILSGVEMIYWVIKFLQEKLFRKRRKKERSGHRAVAPSQDRVSEKIAEIDKRLRWLEQNSRHRVVQLH